MSFLTSKWRSRRIKGLTSLLIPLLLLGVATTVAFSPPAQKPAQASMPSTDSLTIERQLRSIQATTSSTTTTTSTTIAPKPIPRVVTTVPSSEIKVATGDIWEALRNCESGGNYSTNTGNGYYGAYQFSEATWNSMGTGYAFAHLAPPDIQDDAARRLQARSGWSQWPQCSKTIGVR